MTQRSQAFLDAITGHLDRSRTSSADRPIRLAKVDPAYDPFVVYPGAVPPARVTFEGEDTLSGKAYAVASDFIPRAGQRVFMVPIGTTYLIAGPVGSQSPQGFWQSADGADSGVELGGGNYFDTADGLFLETDATIQGQVLHGPRGLRVAEIQVGTASVVASAAGASVTSGTLSYPVAWPAGTTVRVFPSIDGSPAATAHSMVRAELVTHTGFRLVILKTDAARANYAAGDTFPVSWLAVAFPTS